MQRQAGNGSRLKRLRVLKGVKQLHLADLLKVNQSTIARWERGDVDLSEADWQRARLALNLTTTQDDVLKRLVETSTQQVHLVCDLSHRLLAASTSRRSRWNADIAQLMGRPMLQYASEEILKAEAGLDDLGWYDGLTTSISFTTGANTDPVVPIRRGRMRWERVILADGSPARLASTLP